MCQKMARNLITLSMVTVFLVQIECDVLKQVLILSRHHIRTPLIENLQFASTYEFPKWDRKPGYLTEKGALLEGYMAEYFYKWLVAKGLLLDGCPDDETVHIYANTKQRTRESAKAFARAAFKDCNVTVFSIDSDEMDPIFNPVPRNISLDLKADIVDEMQVKLNELQLEDTYVELDEIINLKHANICKIHNFCDLVTEKNDIIYKIGVEPNIMGPLNLGNALVDCFLMSYYEGRPLDEVAWGRIKTDDQWKLITRITKENQNVRFNSTILAREVAKPLLNYMLGIFKREFPPKLTLLVGHDSNLNPVMAALDFVTRDLPGQHERTPVGGKLVFQKWEDETGRAFLKTDFVYQSFEQLRNGSPLSMENPPLWFPMQIKNCSNNQGYCPWNSFMDKLTNII